MQWWLRLHTVIVLDWFVGQWWSAAAHCSGVFRYIGLSEQ